MTTPDADLGQELVRLASADNLRDVAGRAGAPYVAADGVALRTGALFRSNELQLTDADATALAALGVTDLFDLRDEQEVAAHPDAVVPGATWRHVVVRGIPMEAVATLRSLDAARAVMAEVYRAFVLQPETRAGFADLLRLIASARTPQLFHCTAGKDRTGWAAALLLHVAGVADDVIVEDYLLTNAVGGTREKYLAMVREHLGPEMVPVYEAVMVADAAYLQAAHDAVAEEYGDRAAYLRDGLGLDDATLGRLRARLRD